MNQQAIRSMVLALGSFGVAVGCVGEADGIPKEESRTLPRVLATEYKGRTLTSILERDEDHRYLPNVLIAFRATLGHEGGKWLGRAIASGMPSEREYQVLLLDADLEAARASEAVLVDWMRDERRASLRAVLARLVIELGTDVPAGRDVLMSGLVSDDSNDRQIASYAIACLGEQVDLLAAEIVSYLVSCHRDHRPVESHRVTKAFVESSAIDVCSGLVKALSVGGVRVDAQLPRLAEFLGNAQAPKAEILSLFATRDGLPRSCVDAACAEVDSRYVEVRVAAADALGSVSPNSKMAGQCLADLATDHNELVRAAALASLKRLRGDQPD